MELTAHDLLDFRQDIEYRGCCVWEIEGQQLGRVLLNPALEIESRGRLDPVRWDGSAVPDCVCHGCFYLHIWVADILWPRLQALFISDTNEIAAALAEAFSGFIAATEPVSHFILALRSLAADPPEFDGMDIGEGCWADSYDKDGNSQNCGARPDISSRLGLCAEHLEQHRRLNPEVDHG